MHACAVALIMVHSNTIAIMKGRHRCDKGLGEHSALLHHRRLTLGRHAWS